MHRRFAAREDARRAGRPSLARLVLMAAWSLLLVAAAGCARSEPVVHIDMFDNVFGRDLTRVPVGAKVTFRNNGRVPHNAIAVNGAWRTPQVVDPGTSFTAVFDQPGSFVFYCSFHSTPQGRGGMAARITVGEDPGVYGETEGLTGKAALPPVKEPTGVTRQVPEQHSSIQEAVDAADPGDLILIGPGVYAEEVKVTTPSLVLRGTDRNAVVIDAEFKRPNAINITADGVAVENLTVRNALFNGLFWTGVKGYRASYVTAYNNEIYGIYAFGSVDGLFEHSYASGSYDAGFYIGQCDPCDAVIDRVIAENNGLGYSGTNAGGNLRIVRSIWRDNIAGIVPNTLDSELLPPFDKVDIVGNLIYDHGNKGAPFGPTEWSSYGNGIVLAGGNDSLVQRNLLLDNAYHGILVTPNLDENFWTSARNQIRGNVIEGSGRGDLALSGPSGGGNCFSDNQVRTSVPPGLQTFQSCDGLRLPSFGMDVSTTFQSIGLVAEGHTVTPQNESADMPEPPSQPQLPGGAGAPVRPAVEVRANDRLDLASIPLPERPAGLQATTSKEPTVSGITPLATSPWQLVFSFYGYLLPVVLYGAWTTLAIWDLARRDDLSRPATAGWILAILVVPLLGPLAYYVVGRSQLPAWFRATLIGGGALACLVILGVTLVGGGVL
jgi:plastocyanin